MTKEQKGFDPVSVFNRLRENPVHTLSETSQKFLQESPLDYSATRKRQLKAALLNGDEEQFETIVGEYSAVVGVESAIMVALTIWGDMVDPGE